MEAFSDARDNEPTYFDFLPGTGKVFNVARFIAARDNGELNYLEAELQ